jgi:hypothetical protein
LSPMVHEALVPPPLPSQTHDDVVPLSDSLVGSSVPPLQLYRVVPHTP